jgi:hypothetical protein
MTDLSALSDAELQALYAQQPTSQQPNAAVPPPLSGMSDADLQGAYAKTLPPLQALKYKLAQGTTDVTPGIDPAGTVGGDAAGLARGLRDPIDKGAQLLTHGLEAIAPAGSGLESWAQGQAQNVDNLNNQGESAYETANPMGGAGARALGNALIGAPIGAAVGGAFGTSLLGRLAGGATSGGAATVLSNPVDTTKNPDFWGQVGDQAKAGALTGAALVPVAAALGRLVSPSASTNPQVQALMDAGVRPTIGQLAGASGGPVGRALQRGEEALGSVPLVGDFVRSGQAGAVQQFDTGAMNNALAPIGQKLENSTTGREAFTEMSDKIRDAYNQAVPKAGATLDNQAINDFTTLDNMAQSMPADRGTQFQNILQQNIYSKIAPNGGMTGESFKEAESDLGKLASNYIYGHGNTSDERQLGGAIREAQSTLRSWLGRVNPQAAQDISSANQAYAQMLRVEGAAISPSGDPGVFSPAQMLASVKRYSGPTTFARGEAMSQPYAEAGKQILGSRVPDSGTPFRSLATILGAAAAGHMVSPELAIGGALAGGGAAGIYSPVGRSAIATAMASRPALAGPVANLIQSPGAIGAASAQFASPLARLLGQ